MSSILLAWRGGLQVFAEDTIKQKIKDDDEAEDEQEEHPPGHGNPDDDVNFLPQLPEYPENGNGEEDGVELAALHGLSLVAKQYEEWPGMVSDEEL